MNKWLIIGLAIAVVVGGVSAWSMLDGGIPVEAARAQTGPIEQFIDERGRTRLDDPQLVTMPFDGRIAPIDLVEGQPVKQGEVLARVVPRDMELAVDEARQSVQRLNAAIRESSDVSVEQTGLEQARSYVKSMAAAVEAAYNRVSASLARKEVSQSQFERAQTLFRGDQIPKERFEQAELSRVEADVSYKEDILTHTAMQAVYAATQLLPEMVQEYIDRKGLSTSVLNEEQAEAQLRLEQVLQRQERSTMTAQRDGVVLERMKQDEQFLPAGTELLRIGQLDELEVEAEVLSQDVVDVQLGDAVEIYGPAIGSQSARGTVQRINPSGFTKVSSLGVEQQRVRVIIRFQPEELDRVRKQRDLGVDYRVRVRIITDRKEQALVVPRSALFRGADGGWELFVIRQGQARLIPVTVGLMNDRQAEITEGIKPEEPVILAPETTLEDATRVSPIFRKAPI